MHKFKVGDHVGINCQVAPGPFSDEYLVTLETVDGPTSGFVGKDELKQKPDGKWLVHGIIRTINSDTIEVWIKGSFFTTNGLATIQRDLAMAA